MKLKKIDNIMFKVEDLERASKFYSEEMGLKKAWEDKIVGMIGFIFPESDSEISIPDIVIHTNEKIPNPDFNFLVDSVDEFVKNFRGKVLMRMEVRSGKLAVLEDLDWNKIPIVDLTKFNGKPRYN
ncbi:MAG: VOC family protein [Nanoarchaeota archaeon]|nr:VOC family protein [Nanoarchaeota archaeon]